jgi:hypothetical protein
MKHDSKVGKNFFYTVQYKLFRESVKKNYPAEYRRFAASWSNLSLILQPLKKLLPSNVLKIIRNARK